MNKGIFPSPVVCGNCANHDPLWRCPQMMHSQLCTSFEAVDAGDVEVIEEQPYQREQLGGAETIKKVKAKAEKAEAVEAEEVDAEAGETEEVVEEDAGN